jgi:hypothetical protein
VATGWDQGFITTVLRHRSTAFASEPAIVAAAVTMLEALHTVVEPSRRCRWRRCSNGAGVRGQRIGIIVTGGNLDRDDLSELLSLHRPEQCAGLRKLSINDRQRAYA